MVEPWFSGIGKTMRNPERTLRLLLRGSGCLLVAATVAVLLPVSWMSRANDLIGLEPFPAVPLSEYLARSASGLYAMHGGTMIFASTNVRAHSGLIFYLGVVGVLFGLAMVGIDVVSGMPWYWTLFEGPVQIGVNLGFLGLNRQIGRRVDEGCR